MTAWTVNTTAEEKKNEREAITKWLGEKAGKWSFQLEKTQENKDEVELKGDAPIGGKHHWQIMFCLWKKQRGRTVLSDWKKSTLPGGHLCPVSTANGEKMTYTMKSDSRVDGPWSSEKDEEDEEPVMSEDIKEMALSIYPWQKTIIDWSNEPKWEPRLINVLVDVKGCAGKTTLKKWMKFHNKNVADIPPFTEYKDITRFAHSLLKKNKKINVFLIDIPRCFDNQKKLKAMWGAVETVKGGDVYDDRYNGSSISITPPRVWAFSNGWPPKSNMSFDRWVYWKINEKNELVRTIHPDDEPKADVNNIRDLPDSEY